MANFGARVLTLDDSTTEQRENNGLNPYVRSHYRPAIRFSRHNDPASGSAAPPNITRAAALADHGLHSNGPEAFTPRYVLPRRNQMMVNAWTGSSFTVIFTGQISNWTRPHPLGTSKRIARRASLFENFLQLALAHTS